MSENKNGSRKIIMNKVSINVLYPLFFLVTHSK